MSRSPSSSSTSAHPQTHRVVVFVAINRSHRCRPMNGAVPLTWKARATATGFAHPHPVDLVSGDCGGMDGGCRVAERAR